jgi:hypothetical protein
MRSAIVERRRARFDRPHPGPAPYALTSGRPWSDHTEREQNAARAWLERLGIDPARVVVDGLFAFDMTTAEWRVEIQAHRDGVPYTRPDGELATVVRRVWAGPPSTGRIFLTPDTRIEWNGVDITPFLADVALEAR